MTGSITSHDGTMMVLGNHTIIAESSPTGYILACLPSYDGVGVEEYIKWEITIDSIFAQYRMCNRRKIKNAASSLTSCALIWWKDLCDYEEDPRTWRDMKRYMRDEFVPTSHSEKLLFELQCLQQHDKTVTEYYEILETLLLRCGLDESEEAFEIRFLNGLDKKIQDILVDMEYNSLSDLFYLACEIEKQIKYDTCLAEIEHHDTHIVDVPLATNLTQDVESEDERDNTLEKNDRDLASFPRWPQCTEHVKRGNDVSDNFTQGEQNFGALNLSITHAIVEQSIVEPFPKMPLTKSDCLAAPCNKEEFCDDASIIFTSKLVNKLDIVASKPITYAENSLFLPITSAQNELKLLSSLNTLGYIEFDVLCNLNNLKEKLCMNADFPWLSKNTYHVIGRYNCKGDYMVHRVYICSNLKFSFIEQPCDRVEDHYNTNPIMSSSSCSSLFVLSQQDQFLEGEHGWMVSRTATTSTSVNEFESGTTQNEEGEDDVTRSNMHMTKAQLKMEVQAQSKWKSNSFTSPFRTPGAGRTKTDAQVAYGLRFGRSAYTRKGKGIIFPTQPVPSLNSLGVDGNRRNKMTSRICQGAATSVFGPDGLVQFRVSRPPPWPPPILYLVYIQ